MANINHFITEHFTYEEFFNSVTAVRRGLPVNPASISDSIVVFSNLLKVASILEFVRALYARPIQITSGYRSIELNAAVGGVKNSKHLTGSAADIVAEDMLALGEALQKIHDTTYLDNEKLYLFRIVKENVRNGVPSWYHIQLEPICDKFSYESFRYLLI